MRVPAHKNKSALNKACVIKWKNARKGASKPSLTIITPSCLKVERAIIFFISHSVMALSPAIKEVNVAIIKRIELNPG